METTTTAKKVMRKTIKNKAELPKKPSRIEEWWRKHPNGIGKILDLEAVLQ